MFVCMRCVCIIDQSRSKKTCRFSSVKSPEQPREVLPPRRRVFTTGNFLFFTLYKEKAENILLLPRNVCNNNKKKYCLNHLPRFCEVVHFFLHLLKYRFLYIIISLIYNHNLIIYIIMHISFSIYHSLCAPSCFIYSNGRVTMYVSYSHV